MSQTIGKRHTTVDANDRSHEAIRGSVDPRDVPIVSHRGRGGDGSQEDRQEPGLIHLDLVC